MNTTTSLSILMAGLALLLPATQAAGDRESLRHYNLDDGLALQGYDPVAYFEEGGGEPMEGKAGITVVHQGVTYRFASEEHRQLFLRDPARYEPAYGGWCAYAMADGDKVGVDPESFLLDDDGRLLLFYKSFFANTRKRWLEDPQTLQPKADGHWTTISGEPAPEPGTRLNLDPDGVALGGYDPVSYFSEDGPLAGDADITVQHEGAVYRFTSTDNRDRFAAAPERYEPLYGGWCAYAMSQDQQYKVNPRSFLLLDGRLALFWSEPGYDARTAWKADADELRAAADRHWSERAGG